LAFALRAIATTLWEQTRRAVKLGLVRVLSGARVCSDASRAKKAMVRCVDSSKTPAVLIVEDEPLVRLGAVRAIEDAGFGVIEAANADEAIRILENRSDIRVVFTDIHMPGSIDGLKLAHAVRNRWPPIKIIVTSGHGRVSEDDPPEGGRFFAKPYDSTQITNTIRELTR